MITKTDEKALAFINQFHCARSQTLSKLFYGNKLRTTQYRLTKLYEHKAVNRERLFWNKEYVYFTKKTSQLRHFLILSDFYAALKDIADIQLFAIEPTNIEGIRPDAFIQFKLKDTNKTIVAFLEIEISNKGFNIGKFERLKSSGDYKKVCTVFPKIIAITDKKIPDTSLNIKSIKTDLSNIDVLRN